MRPQSGLCGASISLRRCGLGVVLCEGVHIAAELMCPAHVLAICSLMTGRVCGHGYSGTLPSGHRLMCRLHGTRERYGASSGTPGAMCLLSGNSHGNVSPLQTLGPAVCHLPGACVGPSVGAVSVDFFSLAETHRPIVCLAARKVPSADRRPPAASRPPPAAHCPARRAADPNRRRRRGRSSPAALPGNQPLVMTGR